MTFTWGDESDSASESYSVVIKGGPTLPASSPGVLSDRTLTLDRKKTYEIRLTHLSTTLSDPDYDYTLEVTLPDATANPNIALLDPDKLLGDHDSNDDGADFKKKKAYLMPVKFDSTDYSRGFDPPLPKGAPDGSTPPLDIFWTSVAQTPTPVTNPGDIDLNVNNHIVVRFDTDEIAQLCEVVLAEGDDSKVTLEVVDGMKKETKLKITGKPNFGRPTATIHLYEKGRYCHAKEIIEHAQGGRAPADHPEPRDLEGKRKHASRDGTA